MSKRPSETVLNIVPAEKKGKIATTPQMVLMKREFQKGNIKKGAARMDNNVIYKLDCKTLHKNEQNLVYVENKEMYDQIEKDASYNFTIEKRANRWYLLSFERKECEEIEFKEMLSLNDFSNELEVKVPVFVEAAYDSNNKHYTIKIIGCINLDGVYKQCDLVLSLNGTTCFNFDIRETKLQRSKRALTTIYTEMVNKWCVFHVTCHKTHNNNYNLIVNEYSKIDKYNLDKVIDEDQQTSPINNISYSTTRSFKFVEVKKIFKCEFITEGPKRLVIGFETTNNVLVCGAKFFMANEDDENAITDIMSDINSINFDIDTGTKVYCVYSYTPRGDNLLYNVITMLNKEEDEYETIFSS
ncbi:late expression factor 3 [Diatraea saccharalis granulovirus]|uniref:Late expression factor 3 n=1 Tax=Diatraea saccharalis granulovirus TaxID=1675862 RepID=A0A0R7EZ24_9BBAC|nr:late expression factor 3 [Diatraea saccharalis granulovirus]AKN80813.1 late expression factor 3 [Diatraea saccharalis granulovirus]